MVCAILILYHSILLDQTGRDEGGYFIASSSSRNVFGGRRLPVLRQNFAGGQVGELSALIRRQSQLDDHRPAPLASTPPDPLRRPPPSRSGEPRLAPATRGLQENGDPAAWTAQQVVDTFPDDS